MRKVRVTAIIAKARVEDTEPMKARVVQDPDLLRALKFVRDGSPKKVFEGTRDGCKFSARPDLFVIREAWYRGVSFEREADGFGIGLGTHGDWSAIRDSSEEQTAVMLKKAMRFFKKEGDVVNESAVKLAKFLRGHAKNKEVN